jgi:predicted amidohydrolase
MVSSLEALAAENTFVVATLKVMPVLGDKAANFAVLEKLARRAVGGGADFIVTGEGYLDGYMGSPKINPGVTYAKLLAAADTLDSPWVKKAGALASELKVYLMFCFAERLEDKVYNAAALFAPDGSLAGRYYKTHSAPGGELYDPGHELKVFDTKLGRMGVLICFDRQPPENARVLALRGAQFIVIPAYGKISTPIDEDILVQTRAQENGVYVIYTSPRNAFVAGPEGEIVAKVSGDTDELMFAHRGS